MRLVLLLAVALASSAAVQDGQTRNFNGPARYCGYTFAIDLTAGDHIEIENGPDFMLEGLVSPRGGFGLYEGMFPQDGTGDTKVEAGLGKPTYSVGKGPSDFGYVVWTGTKTHPFYVHVWGQAFKGTAADYRLLRRLKFGEAAKRGCTHPTFE